MRVLLFTLSFVDLLQLLILGQLHHLVCRGLGVRLDGGLRLERLVLRLHLVESVLEALELGDLLDDLGDGFRRTAHEHLVLESVKQFFKLVDHEVQALVVFNVLLHEGHALLARQLLVGLGEALALLQLAEQLLPLLVDRLLDQVEVFGRDFGLHDGH